VSHRERRVINVRGLYLQCPDCRAPLVVPFPDDWATTVTADPEGGAPRVTPHSPDCPREGS
jgi:hypothetical protein